MALEERLGTRLVQHSTRTFGVTAAGQQFLQHCQAMIAEADAADNAVAEIQSKPRGTVRVSCPVTMSRTHPGVSKQVLVASRALLRESPQLREREDLTNIPALSAGGRS